MFDSIDGLYGLADDRDGASRIELGVEIGYAQQRANFYLSIWRLTGRLEHLFQNFTRLRLVGVLLQRFLSDVRVEKCALVQLVNFGGQLASFIKFLIFYCALRAFEIKPIQQGL